jgi:hypothetical protein
VDTIVLRAHDGRGAAGLCGLTPDDYLVNYVLAKNMVKELGREYYDRDVKILVAILLGEEIDGEVVRTNWRLNMPRVREYLEQKGLNPFDMLEAKMREGFDNMPSVHNHDHDHGSNGHGHVHHDGVADPTPVSVQ